MFAAVTRDSDWEYAQRETQQDVYKPAASTHDADEPREQQNSDDDVEHIDVDFHRFKSNLNAAVDKPADWRARHRLRR